MRAIFAALAVMISMTGCQTMTTVTEDLPARTIEAAPLSVDQALIGFSNGDEVLVNFERFRQGDRLAFCVWGVANESPGNLLQLWFARAFIYFGEQRVASADMIPIHTGARNGSYVGRCVATGLSFDEISLTKATVRGGSVYGAI